MNQSIEIPSIMRAMVVEQQKQPLVLKTLPVPSPSAQQVLIKVIACGVCRTDLHILDGELAHPKLPLVICHEIVGVIVTKGVDLWQMQILFAGKRKSL